MKGLRRAAMLSVVSTCLLSGCASTEGVIKPEDIADFRPGVTTQQQVMARLGTPSSTSALPGGSTFLVYAFTEPRPAAAQWLPEIVSFVPRSTTISFQFGPDGILTQSNTASSQMGPVAHRDQ